MSNTQSGIKTAARSCGFSLIEVILSAGLIALTVVLGIRVLDNAKLGSTKTNEILDRGLIASYIHGLIRNRATWSRSVAADSDLTTHLKTAASTATHPEASLEIRDENNNVVVGAGGTLFDANGEVTSTTAKARWQINATWKGQTQNSADIAVSIVPMIKGVADPTQGKTYRVFQNSLKDRCMHQITPIIAGSNPAGVNTQQGRPYKYDMATATCPDPYLLVSVNIKTGCGAMDARKYVSPSDNQTGVCHQISPTQSGQQALTGCSPGELDGQCIVTCCIFD